MPSKFLKHEACPECKSKNNLARYDDGHATCFGCGYQEQPTKGDKAEPRMEPLPPPVTPTLDFIETKGLKQVTDSGAIEAMVDAVIANNPEQVEQYRSGKEKVFGFFVGKIMQESKGKANPAQVNQILKDKLSN